MFAVNFPSSEAQTSIFSQILCGHLRQHLFSPLVQRSTAAVVQAAVTLHHKMIHSFLPTAIKFHYTFNLRDLSNIFQVVLIPNNFCNLSIEWKVPYSYDFRCYSGHPVCWAWECQRQHWPGTVVAPRVLQSVLRQTGRCHGPAALPEAPDGDCAWMLRGALQILINSLHFCSSPSFNNSEWKIQMIYSACPLPGTGRQKGDKAAPPLLPFCPNRRWSL